jgi:hypothetical protein
VKNRDGLMLSLSRVMYIGRDGMTHRYLQIDGIDAMRLGLGTIIDKSTQTDIDTWRNDRDGPSMYRSLLNLIRLSLSAQQRESYLPELHRNGRCVQKSCASALCVLYECVSEEYMALGETLTEGRCYSGLLTDIDELCDRTMQCLDRNGDCDISRFVYVSEPEYMTFALTPSAKISTMPSVLRRWAASSARRVLVLPPYRSHSTIGLIEAIELNRRVGVLSSGVKRLVAWEEICTELLGWRGPYYTVHSGSTILPSLAELARACEMDRVTADDIVAYIAQYPEKCHIILRECTWRPIDYGELTPYFGPLTPQLIGWNPSERAWEYLPTSPFRRHRIAQPKGWLALDQLRPFVTPAIRAVLRHYRLEQRTIFDPHTTTARKTLPASFIEPEVREEKHKLVYVPSHPKQKVKHRQRGNVRVSHRFSDDYGDVPSGTYSGQYEGYD